MGKTPEETYQLFVDKIPAPVTPEPEEEIAPLSGRTKVIGRGHARVDGYERVSGDARFTQDVYPTGMLHAAILRCPQAHAMVKSVDTSAAEGMPGVRAVLTSGSPGTDIPWPHTPWLSDRPKQSTLFDRHCRYAGDEVAAVAADTPQQAYDALKAIRVEYEVLPFVLDEVIVAETAAASKLNEVILDRLDADGGLGNGREV